MTPSLEELKKRATAAELTLIMAVEAALRNEITDAVLARLDKKLNGLAGDWMHADMCRPREVADWIGRKWAELREEGMQP